MRKVRMAWFVASLVLIDTGMALALEVEKTDEDNSCRAGYTLLSPDEAKASAQAVCSSLGRFDIVRLQGGGSMSGSGYGCKIRGQDDRSLGNSLCVELVVVEGPGDRNCPKGFTLVTPNAAADNTGYVCSKLSGSAIARLYAGGSMDGPGNNCQVRADDARALGNSMCRQLFQ